MMHDDDETTTPSVGGVDDYDFSLGSRAAWNLTRRLEQYVGGAGIYPVAIVVLDDGQWQLVVENGKIENLGS